MGTQPQKIDLTALSDQELHDRWMSARLRDSSEERVLVEERERRVRANDTKPFNPKYDVSADAHYMWARVFVWFWVVPVVVGLIVFLVNR